jgi:hypothetical protein
MLSSHPGLRVVVATLPEGLRSHPDTENVCRELGVGLKTVEPILGVETVVPLDIEGGGATVRPSKDEGWFPAAILESARGLKNLTFYNEIERFIQEIPACGSDEHLSKELVLRTIDRLLQRHTTFAGNVAQFMRLATFEKLLRLQDSNGSDHVLHSFRVFLAGCPIISKFRRTLSAAHARFRIGKASDARIEYAWLLASIFHDIGRPKEGMRDMVQRFADETLEDEDIESSVTSRPTRWNRPEYVTTRRILGSIAAFAADNGRANCWDGGSFERETGTRISADWVGIYDTLKYHGMIGAIDFFKEVTRRAAADDETKNGPFVLTHAAPAALSIMLHDWRLWPQAQKWGLHPVRIDVLPLAAILIYADTWDDYKRKGKEPRICISKYTVDGRGAEVTVDWLNPSQLAGERSKYESFKFAIRGNMLKLRIIPRAL